MYDNSDCIQTGLSDTEGKEQNMNDKKQKANNFSDCRWYRVDKSCRRYCSWNVTIYFCLMSAKGPTDYVEDRQINIYFCPINKQTNNVPICNCNFLFAIVCNAQFRMSRAKKDDHVRRPPKKYPYQCLVFCMSVKQSYH